MGLIVHRQQMLHRKLSVALRGGEPFVAQHLLNGAQVGAFFEHVRAERVAQRVRVHIRRKSFCDGDLLNDAANAACSQSSAALIDQ